MQVGRRIFLRGVGGAVAAAAATSGGNQAATHSLKMFDGLPLSPGGFPVMAVESSKNWPEELVFLKNLTVKKQEEFQQLQYVRALQKASMLSWSPVYKQLKMLEVERQYSEERKSAIDKVKAVLGDKFDEFWYGMTSTPTPTR